MPPSGSTTLGDVEKQLAMLEFACRKCERFGRYRIARLIEQHGRDMNLPTLREIIAADCPKQQAVSIYDRCGVYYPQLKP